MISAPWLRALSECPQACDPPCQHPRWLIHARAAREHYVYWMFDEAGDCLYVGMTTRPETRWRQHRYQRPMMIKLVAARRMAGPYNYRTAARIEREQQDLLKPRFDGRLRGIERRKQTLARRAAEAAS